MREILFRGKTPRQDEHFDDGKWVEGFYTRFNGKEHRIYSGYAETDCGDYYPDWYNVRPETVGQYTGLTDKNGKKIFEGDIVKTETALYSGENKKERVTRIGVVVYDETFCQFGLDIKGFSRCFMLKRWKGDFNEVIGNIHDNPELMKGGAE